jgi:hypothetical protein
MEISMRIRYLPLLLLPFAASCSTGTMRSQDQMCAEIAKFASAATTGESHAVTLRGGWGGDTPDVLMTHDCQHSGYEPGKSLCAYLLPNTSWEFGHYNAKRAATCLDSPDRQDFIRRMDKDEWPAAITSSLRLLPDKYIQVTVRFESNDLSVLTLSAARQGN